MKTNGNEFKPADIIFYRPRGILGWLVSKITRSDYSHVALVVDQSTIIEANWFTKSRETNFEYLKDVNRVYRLEGITDRKRKEIIKYARTLLGENYDFLSIIGLLFRFVFNFNISFFNKFNGYICSTIIDEAFYTCNIERKDDKYLNYISPQGLISKYNLKKLYLYKR